MTQTTGAVPGSSSSRPVDIFALLTKLQHGEAVSRPQASDLGAALDSLLSEEAHGGNTRLAALANVLPIAIWSLDEHGTIDACFGRGMRRLGLDDGSICGFPIEAWVEPGTSNMRRALGGEAVEWETSGLFDGEPFAIVTLASPRPGGGVVAVSMDRTERHIVQRALSISEGRFHGLAEAVPVGIFVSDPTGSNVFTNPELQAQFGRGEEGTLGMRWLDWVHPEDRPAIEARLGGLRRRGERYDLEYRILLPEDHASSGTGRERWLRVRSQRVFDDDGNHVGNVGITEDVTEKRASERALIASEEQFRTIAESAPIGIFLFDRETSQDYVNPQFEAILDASGPDLSAGAWLAFVHPDDAPFVREQAAAMMERGEPMKVGCRVVRRSGEERRVQVHSVAVPDAAGSVRGVVGTITDVTDASRAEELLRASEEMNRVILETAAEGIVTFDVDGTILTFNDAAERIFGWSAEQAVGRSIGVLLPEPHRDVYLGYLRAYRETGSTRLAGAPARELPGLRREGTTVPIEMAVTEVHAGGRTLFTCVVRDISERKEFERQLEHQATHDPLTSLPNRALLAAQLESALARAYRARSSVAVLFVALDRVKMVTDSLGHRAGDELRVAAAHRLQGVVRPSDTVTRFGEDEFVVLAEDLQDVASAVDIAQRVIDAMEVGFDLTIDEAFIGCNVGIAFALDGLGTAESLIGDADLAMFRAKERGSSTFEIFDSEMRAWINERRKTEVALRHALDRSEFELHYQPIVTVVDGAVKGVEALVRWNRGDMGLVPPGEFIPVAEESGLIVPIGEWILGEACRQAAEWEQTLPNRRLSVSVNLSGRQLAQRNIADVIQLSLDQAGADPSSLVMEITETVLLDDVEQAVRSLSAMKDIGVRLSIDDFGTGYSSLTYLRRFPIDIVKIDRSFVSKLGTDSRDASIVNAVILLANGLGLDVVAEGVETREQLELLSALRCQFAQGYYFARPQPVPGLAAILN